MLYFDKATREHLDGSKYLSRRVTEIPALNNEAVIKKLNRGSDLFYWRGAWAEDGLAKKTLLSIVQHSFYNICYNKYFYIPTCFFCSQSFQINLQS